ncbi:facilitated trehalose transporter Tret1-like [Maniola jurtina]|uniref:facilitated trehalose transporter Tret1-like n=1 Tax=Maniola jurtina TaxID=191418 RepID=UPI001E68F0D4|nr:facilitated trehalose transporter Tret1-like [Maniola jurtina]
MDSCNYKEVNCAEDVIKEKESLISITKQIFISSAVWVQFFMTGMCIGAPTVFIPQIKNETNSTQVIDEEMGSWLFSTSGFAMYPWLIILPLFTKRYGRKLPQLITAICSIAIFIILYFSQNVIQILVSEVLQGFVYAGNISVRILIVTDYTSPKYRGVFLAIKSASFFWGIWMANAIGTFFYWKNIAIVGFICAVYTLNVLLWPESPYWLASKGRFVECRKSFRWIHGVNTKSEIELKELIKVQTERIRLENEYGKMGFKEMVKSSEFYKPLFLSIATIVQYHFSGKIAISLYILDIFKNITADERSAYMAMLILDGVTVFGMYVGSFLSRILKRRTLYMSCSFTGVAVLFAISVYLFLVRLNVLDENHFVTIALLCLYSIAISCGPLILSFSLYGELISLKFQAISYTLVSLTFGVSYSTLIKVSPSMFRNFGIDGTFLFFTATCGLITIYLYFCLPETKNKTQLEIEAYFKNKSKVIQNDYNSVLLTKEVY